MITIALHGDFASAKLLERDCGSPTWITHYFDGGKWKLNDILRLRRWIVEIGSPINLVGYSRGGSVIANLASCPDVTDLIRSAVVYESPVKDFPCCGGDFPVLMIWNDRGRLSKFMTTDDAIIAMREWQASHSVTLMIGRGTHVKVNPVGHAWDTTINPRIVEWLNRAISTKGASE